MSKSILSGLLLFLLLAGCAVQQEQAPAVTAQPTAAVETTTTTMPAKPPTPAPAAGVTAAARPTAAVTPTVPPGMYIYPVYHRDFPDPDVLYDGDTYYAYATNSDNIHVQVAASADLVHWKALPDALPQLPAWAVQDFGWTWAPDVSRPTADGPYVMYYTTRLAIGTGGRSRLSFLADVPPMGYRVYHVAQRPSVKEFPLVEASKNVLDGPGYRLEIDAETGAIASLRDKKNNVDVFMGQAALPVVIQDTSDTWSHDVFHFDRVIGQFEVQTVKLVEHGPAKSVLRVTSGYGSSRLVQDFTMYPELDRIDVFVTVDWHEQFKLLKLRFPVNVRHVRVTYEIPYGSIERMANGDEEPMQSWGDVSGISRDAEIPYGFSLLSFGKYSVDVNVRDIGLTVLCSPIYAHHVPAAPEEGRLYSFQDQGTQRFRYALCPHRGSWESVSTFRRGAELREPLIALVGTYHPAAGLPQTDSFVSVEPDNMIVPVVKKSEDGDDVIVRVVETTKAATQATIRVPRLNRTIEAEFAPGEIKTFLVPRDPAKPVIETDLIERPLA